MNFKTTKARLWSPKPMDIYLTEDVVVIIDSHDESDITVDFCSRGNWDYCTPHYNGLDMYELTGKGNMLTVLNTVMAAIEEFVKTSDVKRVTFSGCCPKRVRIYNWFTKKKGYTIEEGKDSVSVVLN